MKSPGFKLKKENGQAILDFVLPQELDGLFSVSLYGRGPLLDKAEGKPSIIWDGFDEEIKRKRGLVAPIQKHGVTVALAAAANAMPVRPDADGVYIDAGSDACASLRFADCAPVVIACAGSSPWVLALHSGFVGTVKNIAGTALTEALQRNAGTDAGRIYAWIGPAICAGCYTRKLDDPSTRRAMEVFSPANFVMGEGRVNFDIKGEIKRRLAERGVSPGDIYVSELCTSCSNDIFYSYRCGDESGRNFLLVTNTTKTAI